MTKKLASTKSMAFRGIALKELFSWKNANLGFVLLGLFYIVFPWFTSGTFNTVTALFGMMFLSIGIIRSKSSVTVLGGLFAAFLGMSYFFATIAFIDIGLLWTMSLVFFVLFMIFELGLFKVGPNTSQAKAFILVPLSLLTFSLLLAFAGKNPTLLIDWSQIWVALNYLSVLCFSLFSTLGIVGWRIGGKRANVVLLLFAVMAVATAFVGMGQGTLWAWT